MAGWATIVSFFIFLPFLGKPAFIVLTIGGLLCAVALALDKAPSAQASLASTATIGRSTSSPDRSLGSTQPPVGPNELRAFKTAAWIVLALGAAAFLLICWYGDAPRPFVDWLNAFVLSPLVVVMLAIVAYGLVRFRRACREVSGDGSGINNSDETHC